MYALQCATPWVLWANPGPDRVINPAKNTRGKLTNLYNTILEVEFIIPMRM